MKKSFIPLTALALFALVSCGPNPVESSSSSVDEPASSIDAPSSSVDEPVSSIDAPSSSVDVPSSSESKSSEDVVNSISITNKEELQAAWAVESANRTLSIAVDPAGNINLLINQGKITIVSSNPEVVKVTGRVLSAISAGTAKITVTYGDKSDSVDLTVSPAQNAINLYGTVHAGTATDPLDNADALKVAKATGTTATEKYFYVKGVVDYFRDAPSSYGNVSYYLKANSGDAKFLVYRAVLSKDFKADGSTKVTDEDIWVGATVTAKVKIVNFKNSVPETEEGGEITKVEGEKITVNNIEATVAEAIAATKALDANATSVDNYIITGYIVATSSEGFYIADTKGAITPTKDDFLVYGYSGDNKDQCTLNAKVKVKCTLKYYVSTSEEGKYAVETSKVISVDILEAGDAPVAAEEIDVAKALEIVNGLEEGKTTEKEYAITGYVTEVTSAWSDQFKNMSYKIGASADAKDVLEVFRTKLADGVDSSKIVAGAKVKVTAYLDKHVQTKDGVKTVSLQATKGTTKFLSEAVGSTINATVAEAIAAANKLASEAVSADTYVITGYDAKVTNEWTAKFKNMSVTLSDEIDDPDAKFIAFQVGCTEEVSKKIVAGAKVKVTGALTNYKGTPETVNKGAAKIEFLEAASGTAVSASISSSTLKIGETSQITASAGEGDTFTYASSDDAVATVSETGLVTAVARGDARITITSSTGRKAYIEVSVAGSNDFMVTSFADVKGTLGETGYTYKAEKGKADNPPFLAKNSAIRVYQKGGIFTVEGGAEAKALVSLTIVSDGASDGEGPFTYVYGASAESVGEAVKAPAWSNHKVTLNFEGTGVKFFKLTTTGTSPSKRVYVKGLTLAFAE